jgi:ubiquinone/menaquinone biosynthesis C-methylase UbiE
MSAIDISEEGCISTRRRLQDLGLPFETIRAMDAHALAFPNDTFDLVFIAGTLHHVEIRTVLSEVKRVLNPGGRVVCYEPMQYGRCMRALKDAWLFVNGLLKDRARTQHGESLTDRDPVPFREIFSRGVIRKFNFLAKTNRLKRRALAQSLRRADYILLSVLPPLRRYCTCVVCCFEK